MPVIQTWQPGETGAVILSLFENKQKLLLYCEYYEAIFWAAWTPAYKVHVLHLLKHYNVNTKDNNLRHQ